MAHIPGPTRIVSGNVTPLAPGFNEPEVENVKEVIEPLPTFGGLIRRAFIGKSAFPATNAGPHTVDTDPDTTVANPEGVRVYFMDLAPRFETPMHRTLSSDYAIVQKGSPTLITPKGKFSLVDGKANYTETVETVVKEGEVIVQRGQFHAWKNNSDEWVRFLIFTIGAEVQQVDVNGEAKAIEEIWL